MPENNGQARFPLDATVLQRLDNLTLLTRRSMATGRPGRRRSPMAGSSMEFADYRRYAPGDDFRRIDWRAYARLERLFLRVFEAEENITVTILIDCSGSMQHGTPAKIELAQKLAAALAYVALKSEDSVIIGTLADHLLNFRRAGSGKNAIWSIGDFLNKLPTAGTTDLNKALYELGRVINGPGLTIILSDFLVASGYQTGIRAVRQLRQDVALLQILAPEELEPEIQGDWQLKDSEGHSSVDVSISSNVLQAYHERLSIFLGDLEAFAHKNMATYTMIPSDTTILDVVQRLLRQIALVK
ncbi:DUF58 domain-containing protein [Ktedonosporobacter rubrisoli]|uniref:DUF58 domain-containing protein n=1 Tax=Ktedonosporobacter rubrisoli TaxID=2509675 RepID=A0A4V0Z033_KTERU|nr:DUF58 domain-containing protein [Ktedonosporobacter rubrisoli]QBD81821.1 DUF58 domain-containing protein [Ktedonosporobacter rubrisoli]